MKIPKKYKLGGVTWSVIFTHELFNAMGCCNNETGVLTIKNMDNPSITEQTFCHELIHSILYSMGRTEHNEEFVDTFAVFLHQYLSQTYKGD